MTTNREDALSADAIRSRLAPAASSALRELTVLGEVDSTNAVVARLPPPRRHRHVVLAESQTQGRGRRQRTWFSPAGGNIYLSLGWRFPAPAPRLSSLPLAVAVCLAVALERAGLRGHGIKWPNDILIAGSKLAGILVESQAAGSGTLDAVVGVGLNVRMPFSAENAGIDRPWTDLVAHLPPQGRDISRNEIAALMLGELLPGIARFEAEGFEPFRAGWGRFDLLTGRRVRLEDNGNFRLGTALGIDASGGLSIDIEDYGPQVLHAADVTIWDD